MGGHRGLRNAPPLLDSLLVVVVVGPEDGGRLAVLGKGEHRIGVGEVHDLQRVGIGHPWPWWPFCNEDRCPDRVIVVAKKTHVHVEVLDEDGKDLLGDDDRGRRIRRHEPDGDGGHQPVQAQGRVFGGHQISVTAAGRY